MKVKKIKTIKDLEEILLNNFNASISSVAEVNTFEHYNLEGDNEHDYTQLGKVYKILGEGNTGNDYAEVFLVVFVEGDRILDVKQLGMSTEKLDSIWEHVDWI